MYIAKGKDYCSEAEESAKRLRKVDGKAHITLVTDEKGNVTSGVFDNVVIRPSDTRGWYAGLFYKARYMYECSPYKKTFFIDTDTYFCDSCRELFEILNFYDLCISHAPRDTEEVTLPGNRTLGGYYPYNSGVVLFRKSGENEKLFRNWHAIYKKKSGEYEKDQIALMEALLHSGSRVYVLQNIYNARTPFQISFVKKPVKIIHGKHGEFSGFEKICSIINASSCNRSWNPDKKKITVNRNG